MSVAAVVFDLDGLLVDSEPLQAWAWETYVARYGAVMTPAVLGRMLGLRAVDAVEIAVELLDLPVSPATALRERDEIFLAAVPGAVHPRAGATRLIADLRQRGIPIALATSGHRRYVDLALASANLTGAFDAEITGDVVQRGKPHPDVYLHAAGALGVPPEDSLALEDAPNGVAAAKAAGMLCFAVPNAPDAPHDLSQADAILPSLAEVIRELERRGQVSSVRRPRDRRSSRR